MPPLSLSFLSIRLATRASAPPFFLLAPLSLSEPGSSLSLSLPFLSLSLGLGLSGDDGQLPRLGYELWMITQAWVWM